MNELQNEINRLKKENESLRKQIKKLENKLETKNERNAGRKKKLSDAEIEQIKMYRFQNKTIKDIATMYGVSVGLIHKIVSKKQKSSK